MELTSIHHLSVDGVFQGPGGPEEDPSDGFDRGGWSAGFGDEQSGAFINGLFQDPGGFLLGRRTYDIWVDYWPKQTDPDFQKAQPGGDLHLWGSGTLLRSLLAAGLMDRVILIIYPVIVGKGMRLFAEDGPDLKLAVEESRTTPSGVTIQTYRPDGRPEYATVG